MKLLLGSLLFAGVCWLGAAVTFTTMPNFMSRKVSGQWYPAAHIVLEKRFPPYTLKIGPTGNLLYSIRHSVDGKCKTKTAKFTELGQAGKYNASSQSTVQILDTDYQSYLITYIEQGMGGYLTLATKQRTLSSELETKFKEFATTAGVTGDVVRVALAETC